jgi:hypothetical protein
MPIIPRNNEAVQIQPRNPVPIAGTGDARIAGESLANLGGAIANVGAKVKDYYDKQDEFERQNDVNEAKNALQNVYKSAADYAARVSKPDGSDLSDNYYKKANPEAAKVVSDYGQDPQSNRDIMSYGRMLKSDADTHLTIEGAKMQEKNNYKRLEDQADVSADRVRGTPNEKMVAAESMTYGNQIYDLVN